MRSGTEQKQLKFTAVDPVDQKPIRFDMAFSEIIIIAQERMIMILVSQFLLIGHSSISFITLNAKHHVDIVNTNC